MTRKSKALGLPTASGQNYQKIGGGTGNVWMQPIDRGTLVIKPEYRDKGLHEILEDADMAFEVLKVPTTYVSPVNGDVKVSNGFSIIRADNDVELGYGMTDAYNPISYTEILDTFFHGIKELGGIPTRAISFRGGAVGAIQVLMPDSWYVGDLEHGSFYNFYASHNGSYSIVTNSAGIPIICGNTFRTSYSSNLLKNSVKHTINMRSHIDEIANSILADRPAQIAYYSLLNQAISTPATSEIEKQFLAFMIPDGQQNAESQRKENAGPANRRIELENAIGQTAGERNSSDISLYDLFGGSVRYTNYRTQKRSASEQWEYVTAGSGDVFNQKAYSWLKETLK